MQMESPLALPSIEVPFCNASLKKFESGLTMYNITMLRKRSRDSPITGPTGLLLVPQKTKLLSQPFILDQELLFHFELRAQACHWRNRCLENEEWEGKGSNDSVIIIVEERNDIVDVIVEI
ncbi:hypothetical protein VNO78_34296 [Psophocarpus tetragonolobus]|uniref:Uncharacterized protein n=1 Tax=Psophocarpus tetragonolobus TaxID=3891 RepID=A0AAN9NZ59_PSOTE